MKTETKIRDEEANDLGCLLSRMSADVGQLQTFQVLELLPLLTEEASLHSHPADSFEKWLHLSQLLIANIFVYMFFFFLPSCWTCACLMSSALSFPTASSLLQPCFTSRLWSLWKMSRVRTIMWDWNAAGLSFLSGVCLTRRFLSACSSEEGGGGGVCEVDGSFRHGAAWEWRLLHENVHGNTCRWHAQHPDPCIIHDVAGAFISSYLAHHDQFTPCCVPEIAKILWGSSATFQL